MPGADGERPGERGPAVHVVPGCRDRDRGDSSEDLGPPSPKISAPHATGSDGLLLRVPLLYSGGVRTSRPGAAPPRTAAGDARPPTDPARCPGPRTPHGSIGTRSCSG